jgi:Phage capsid protein
MADVITGAATELDSTKATLIAAMVQKELAFKAKLLPFVTDVSAMAVPGAKIIQFPKLTSFSVVNRAEGAAGASSALTSSTDSLALNYNAYVAWTIDNYSEIQSNINAQLEFAKLAASAQARYVDNQIIATLASVCSSFQNVGTDIDITYANIVTMMKLLKQNDADPSQAAWIISPQQEAALFSIAEIKNWNQFGQAVLPNGVVGNVLGVPVVVHNGLAGKQAFLVEKSGIALGFQKQASYGEQSAIDYGVGAKKCAIDQLFGVGGLQLGFKGAAAGKSPLVLGLND